MDRNSRDDYNGKFTGKAVTEATGTQGARTSADDSVQTSAAPHMMERQSPGRSLSLQRPLLSLQGVIAKGGWLVRGLRGRAREAF